MEFMSPNLGLAAHCSKDSTDRRWLEKGRLLYSGGQQPGEKADSCPKTLKILLACESS